MSTIKSSAENLTLNADGANNDVIIQSNGSTKVTLDGANGRVGINTNSHHDTSTKLTVDGRINTSNGTATGSINYGGGSVVNVGALTNHPVNLIINNSTKWLIDTNGNLVAEGGGGIVLGNTSYAAANELDDYEEGTWTPVIAGTGGNNPSVTYAIRHAHYTKIGNMVIAVFKINIASGGISGGGGDAAINGLPFAVQSQSDGGGGMGTVTMGDLRYEGSYSSGRNSLMLKTQAGSSQLLFRQYKPETPASLNTGIAITQIDDGLLQLECSISYLT